MHRHDIRRYNRLNAFEVLGEPLQRHAFVPETAAAIIAAAAAATAGAGVRRIRHGDVPADTNTSAGVFRGLSGEQRNKAKKKKAHVHYILIFGLCECWKRRLTSIWGTFVC